jgi:hypothetical protein
MRLLRLSLAIGHARVHNQAPVSPELAQVSLVVLGWLVAFLLGKELATGYVQWRAGRRDDNRPWP